MLEEALAAFDGTILVVSHDRYFLDRVCDQIIAFEPDGIHIQPGNYSYYLEKKQERVRRHKDLERKYAMPAESAPLAPVVRPVRKLTNNEKAELDGMEEAILNAEQEAVALESLLNDPAFHAARAAEAPAMVARLEDAKSDIERLYARWEELSNL